ncbi:hypothetical protein, partial [Alistipes putredinis]|uniref:hypothetical protein n=1 Tax=Alistipes putredinis TaxID=28117 RepID=UPI003AB5FDEC
MERKIKDGRFEKAEEFRRQITGRDEIRRSRLNIRTGSSGAAECRLFRRRPAKRQRWKYARLAPRAIRMALHISISDDKFPAGGKTYIENYPAIDEVRSGIELAV